MGEGLDDAALSGLEIALDEFSLAWRTQSMIPKASASVLAELWPAIESSSYLYPDERGEQIRAQAAHLSDRIAACFIETGGEQ